MASSSRIFVRGLPPTFTEEEFRSHFSKRHTVTDVKLFAHRRFGYVGFKTPEDATSAIKYFNKSFIRMSKISVEIAQPYSESHKASDLPQTDRLNDKPDKVTNSETADERSRKRKRDEDNPKLQEFLGLMQPPSKLKTWLEDELKPKDTTLYETNDNDDSDAFDEQVDEDHPRRKSKDSIDEAPVIAADSSAEPNATDSIPRTIQPPEQNEAPHKEDKDLVMTNTDNATSDSEWLRSRTSRLLGLVEDDDEDETMEEPGPQQQARNESSRPDEPEDFSKSTIPKANAPKDADPAESETPAEAVEPNLDKIRKSSRLFVRNLPYTVQEEDLTGLFSSVGELQEVHVPIDSTGLKAKGFAYVEFLDAEAAIEAYQSLDGSIFQGRLLHILPASGKRESKLDEFAVSQLPLKKQKQIQRKTEAASTTFNWNSMYMNPDAVVSSMADKLGVSKSDLLDPTSSDAAVKQAQAETHVIQETKNYFENNGVDLKAFGKRQRSDTAILVKNFQFGTKPGELKRIFEEYGTVSRFLMPSTGTIAIVEFVQAPQARAAFGALAYRKMGSSVLFLEKAPKDIFKSGAPKKSEEHIPIVQDSTQDVIDSSTLFVKNLNFSTRDDKFRETFRPLDGFLSARVKMKSNGVSAGFGFLEFKSKEQAKAALVAMDGFNLDGHRLEIKASNKGLDAAEERRKDDAAKRAKMRKSKIVIKNLPFEASKKDVRNLFKTYGQLRAVRVPKKFDNTTKGFAFAEFTTAREAESAMDALRHVHFLGRRLNMEFASGEIEDPEKEIEKMQQKVGQQSNSMAIQRLKGTGRKKFSLNGTNEDDLDE